MTGVRVRGRETFSRAELTALLRWLEVAYRDPPGSWRAEHWDELGPGPHLTIEDEGAVLAHACISWVPVWIGRVQVVAGYVEDVATRADVRRRGYATALIEATRPLIEEHAELGLLSTGRHAFYERLGWVRWIGPSSVSEIDGTVTPTPEDDDGIMALFVARTPPGISTDLSIRRPRRDPAEAW